MDIMTWVLRILYGTVGVTGLGLSLMYALQEKLIYVPRIPGVSNELVYTPDKFGFSFEDVWLTAADGVKLHSWFMWPADWKSEVLSSKPTIIFFQENAGSMAWRLPFLRQLARFLDCSILAPSYRGYGLSEGSPSEAGLQLDAQAALNYLLKERSDIDRSNISLFGRSLGGAVTIHLAARNAENIRSVMIENTFTSIEEVAPRLFPLLKFFIGPGRFCNFLVRNKWESRRDIARLANTPVLLLSSLKDEMLPPEQMRQLYERLQQAGAKRAVWTEFPDGTHMEAYDICRQQYWPAVRAFFDKYALNEDWEVEDAEADVKEAAPAAKVEATKR